MNKKVPKIFVNKIDKIYNNKEVYYSYKDNTNDIELVSVNEFEIQKKINDLFKSNDFIYKKKFHIKTKYGEDDYIIISKSYDYLLTITGERIYISNILDIK